MNDFGQTSNLRKTKSLVPRLLKWFSANIRDLPWRRTRAPYAFWVSENIINDMDDKYSIQMAQSFME